MSFSILVISDIDHFVAMKEFWDSEITHHTDNPFFFSNMLIEHYKLSQKLGYSPLLVIFLSDDKVVGFAPLVVRSRFGVRQASNLHEYVHADFFVDDYREFFFDILLDLLLVRLKCESIELVFEEGSVNQRVLEKVCSKKRLNNYKVLVEGEAIIVLDKTLEAFQGSFSSKRRKYFKKIAGKVDALGSWWIYGVEPNANVCAKVWEVEKNSWKKNLQGKNKAIKNWGLSLVLSSINQTQLVFDSKIWFLELNGVQIAYQVVMNSEKTAYFIKTSYDSRFRKASPGIFLINDIIERYFKEKTVDKINFVSNQPFVKNWKPVVNNRIKIIVKQDLTISMIRRFLIENKFSSKIVEFLDSLKWKKIYP